MSGSSTFSKQVVNQIKELKLLLDQGALSQDEYEQQKNALLFQSGTSSSTVATKNQPQHVRTANQSGNKETVVPDIPSAKTNADNTKFDEIVAFKKLVDGGIITQDEFNQKKEELLGINSTASNRKQAAAKPAIKILASIIIAFAIGLLMVFLLNQSYKTSAFIAPGFLGTFVVVFLLIYMTWK